MTQFTTIITILSLAAWAGSLALRISANFGQSMRARKLRHLVGMVLLTFALFFLTIGLFLMDALTGQLSLNTILAVLTGILTALTASRALSEKAAFDQNKNDV